MKRWLLIIALNLVACTTHQPINGTAIDDATVDLHESLRNNQALPADHASRARGEISKALMPDIRFRSPRQMDYRDRRFDIAVKDVPANTFYMGLVTDTPVSIVVSPEIKGNITLNLKQVTIEQVLQALEDTYEYTFNAIPGGYEILPNTLKTKIYSVNYLELQRNGTSEMRLQSGELSGVVPIGGMGGIGGIGGAGGGLGGLGGQQGGLASGGIVQANNGEFIGVGGVGANLQAGTIGKVKSESSVDFWKELQFTLKSMVGKDDNRTVTVNPLAGVVVVRAFPKELKQVEAYLDMVQNSVDRQVILEVKVLEVTLNNEYQMGIDWKAYGAQLNATQGFRGTDIKPDDFKDTFNVRVRWLGDFVSTIKMLETQGNVQVLSSPRVATMNNQKSLIKVGTDEFFVSGIAGGQATLGVASQATQQISPFFSGITLDVTPQIDVNGDVTLHVHPSVSLVTEQIKRLSMGNTGNTIATPQNPDGLTPTPLARSTIRESDTVVHAKNGQVVIIGGLMQNQTIEDVGQLPFFGNIPFMGTLFRSTKQQSQKSELVILIKPTVINKTAVNRDIMRATQRTAGLKQGFHFGGRPDIYGNEGEEPIRLGPQAGDFVLPSRVRCSKGQRCVVQQQAKAQAPMKE